MEDSVNKLKTKRKEFYGKIKNDDTLGIILKGHLIIEKELDDLLKWLIVNDKKMELQFFSAKLNAAYALGLIDQEWYGVFNKFNKIRNDLAHKLDYEFTATEYDNLVKTLSKDAKHDFENDLDFMSIIAKPEDFTLNPNIILNDRIKLIVLVWQLIVYLHVQIERIDIVFEEIHLMHKEKLIDYKLNKMERNENDSKEEDE